MTKRLLSIFIAICLLISSNFIILASDEDNLTLTMSKDSVTIQTSLKLDGANLILASYSMDNKLVDVKVLQVNISVGTTEFPMPNDLKAALSGKIKAILLNKTNDLMLERIINLPPSSYYGLETITSNQIESFEIISDYIGVNYHKNPNDRFLTTCRIDLENLNVYVDGALVNNTAEYIVKNIIGKGCFYGEFDLEGNGKVKYDFNTILLSNYQSIVVKSVSDTAIFPYNNVSVLDLNGIKNVFFYDNDGKQLNLSDLKEWDVISYTKREAKNYIFGWVINDNVSGTVQSKSNSGTDTTFNINGTEYGIADGFNPENIAVGDSGTFFLDKLGNIVFYKITAPLSSDYAYIIDIQAVKGNPSTVSLKLFNTDGTVSNQKVASSLYLDGIKINSQDMLDVDSKLKDVAVNYNTDLSMLVKNQGTEYFVFNSEKTAITAIRKIAAGQLVTIMKDTSGKITSIDRATKVDSVADGKGKFSQYKSNFAESVFSDKSLTAGTSKLFITKSTVIIYATVGSKDEYYFELINTTTIPNEFVLGNVNFYNVNDHNEIGAVIINGNPVTSCVSSEIIVADKPSGYTKNRHGDNVGLISGLMYGEALSHDMVTTSDANININTGDVFVPLINASGEIKSIKLLASADNDANKIVITQNVIDKNKVLNGKVKYYFGNIAGIQNKTISLVDKPNDSSDDMIIDGEKVTKFSVYHVNIFLYDERKQENERVSGSSKIRLSNYHVNIDSNGNYIYTDDSDKSAISNMAVFVREYDADVADVVLYIFK